MTDELDNLQVDRRSKVQRMLHPQCAADYRLSVTMEEMLSDPEGRSEWIDAMSKYPNTERPLHDTEREVTN